MTNEQDIQKATEQVKRAEHELAEARKLLEQATKPSIREAYEALPEGSLFKTGYPGEQVAATVDFYKHASGVVSRFGRSWTHEEFIESETNIGRAKVYEVYTPPVW